MTTPLSETGEPPGESPFPEGPLPVEMDRLSDVTGGDEETMRELIALFYRQTPQQFSQIETAIQQGNATEIRRVAHSCAGASATLGMVRLVPLLRAMEKFGQVGDLREVPQLYQSALNEYQLIQQFIETQPGLGSIQARQA